MTMVPSSTGIGAPGSAPAPASLSRSPMSSTPAQGGQQSIPFTRGSTLATMKDASITPAAGVTTPIVLQTNAFLESLILDVSFTSTNGSSNNVAYAADGPFSCLSQVVLNDPAGQAIITPITGYQLYLLNKYLPDTDCGFDPKLDPNYAAATGTSATGSFSFRLVIPVEHRRRDAFGALNNSAANQRYQLQITTLSSFSTTGQAYIYTTAPSSVGTTLTINIYQQYWTSPPSVITTSQGSSQVQPTPSGLGSVGFVRYESHNEMNGGGSPQIQLNNVGDYISNLIFVLRNNASPAVRDQSDWPAEFDWWVNDFQVHALSVNDWQRWMSRHYGYTAAGASASSTTASVPDAAGGLDIGVYVLSPWLAGLLDRRENFTFANQYLATDATTKLQIRGSTWGSTAGKLEVISRMVRPVSGAALFS